MGEKQNAEVALFYAKDGHFEKVQKISAISELPEIMTYIDGKRDITPDLSEMSMTVNLKIPKEWRCKSRKRFIKLLMAKGMRRDCAVLNADIVRAIGISYSDAWFRRCVVGL